MSELANKRHVIVSAVDLSEYSDVVVEMAIDTALRNAPSDLHFVTVVPAAVGPFHRTGGHEAELHEANQRLRGLVAEIASAFAGGGVYGALSLYTHARVGKPVDEICDLIDESNADLLVVGRHGWGKSRRSRVGSLSEKLFRESRCSVLLVRPKEMTVGDEMEAPCPECVNVRRTSNGDCWFCERHRDHEHGRHLHGPLAISGSLQPGQIF